MGKIIKKFKYIFVLLICLGMIVPVNALKITQDRSASIIRPYTFGFGSINDSDEGVSKLIEVGNFKHLTYTDSTGYSIKYWAHIPTDINGNYIENLPLVMYMHGYSDGGDNNIAIRYHNGVVFKLIQQQDIPERQAIILVPQTPNAENGAGENDYFKDQWVGIKGNDKWSQWNNSEWDMNNIARTKNLNAVVELVKTTQRVTKSDVDRAYVTGISMGGYATWDLVSRDNENLFAAAVPICGVGDLNKIENVKNTPIKIYHGLLDATINPLSSQKMYSALRKYGNVSYVEYEKENHPSWNAAYSPVLDDDNNGESNLDDLIFWMFNQSRNGTLDGKVDKGPLNSVIWDAKQEKEENYSFSKWEKLQKTIAQAELLYNTYCSSNEIKNIIKTLDTLITDEYKDKADMSKLLKKIEEAEKLGEANYTSVSWYEFRQALMMAQEIVKNPDALQENIDAILLILETSINNLVSVDNGINKIALKIALEVADGVTQEQLDRVVPVVAKEFNEALDNAKEVYDNANATQDVVNNAFARLAKVMRMLEFFKGDKVQLQKIIDHIEGLTASDYTDSTWDAMQPALIKANKVLVNANAMQGEVDQAHSDLVKVFLNLKLKPNKDMLEELINKANSLREENYIPASWAKMIKVLDEVKAVHENPEATIVEVEKACTEITKALRELAKTSDSKVENNLLVKPRDTTVKATKTGDNSLVGIFTGLTIVSIVGLSILRKKEEF